MLHFLCNSILHKCYLCGKHRQMKLKLVLVSPTHSKRNYPFYSSCSTSEVVDAGERVKRFKPGKEKKKKHKVEKMKDEEIESVEDYDRQIPMGELEDQEFSSRGSSKRKLVDSKSSVEGVKKKRPVEELSNYRERSGRSSSSKISAGVPESDRSREGGLWKPSANEGYKQAESPLERYRDDRHGSARKTKSHLLADEEYTRRGRDRERDRPSDGATDYNSRKRKRLSLLRYIQLIIYPFPLSATF